ncbi:hypothetical protein DNTS_020378 [Danionella cerebrum]|uniref:Uncharacterized protein n=1 Tax=Danionella cerebrum TaxID=2873325 RepID=A0A553Q6M1_9TELE|nr:hypothetical protein DNTS_020378 [Danionella translucida]
MSFHQEQALSIEKFVAELALGKIDLRKNLTDESNHSVFKEKLTVYSATHWLQKEPSKQKANGKIDELFH